MDVAKRGVVIRHLAYSFRPREDLEHALLSPEYLINRPGIGGDRAHQAAKAGSAKKRCQGTEFRTRKSPQLSGTTSSEQRERQMSDSDDIRAMSDPDFLAERTRVRETIEALQDRDRLLTEEFDRRARIAWTNGDAA